MTNNTNLEENVVLVTLSSMCLGNVPRCLSRSTALLF